MRKDYVIDAIAARGKIALKLKSADIGATDLEQSMDCGWVESHATYHR